MSLVQVFNASCEPRLVRFRQSAPTYIWIEPDHMQYRSGTVLVYETPGGDLYGRVQCEGDMPVGDPASWTLATVSSYGLLKELEGFHYWAARLSWTGEVIENDDRARLVDALLRNGLTFDEAILMTDAALGKRVAS